MSSLRLSATLGGGILENELDAALARITGGFLVSKVADLMIGGLVDAGGGGGGGGSRVDIVRASLATGGEGAPSYSLLMTVFRTACPAGCDRMDMLE